LLFGRLRHRSSSAGSTQTFPNPALDSAEEAVHARDRDSTLPCNVSRRKAQLLPETQQLLFRSQLSCVFINDDAVAKHVRKVGGVLVPAPFWTTQVMCRRAAMTSYGLLVGGSLGHKMLQRTAKVNAYAGFRGGNSFLKSRCC
jgi:hypothetical protein